jgi:hypothetical protein
VKKHLFSALVLVLTLGFLTPQFAQDAPNSPPTPDQARHALAIGFLRTINTTEVVEHTTYGAFASWETLLSHQQDHLQKWFARFSPPGTAVRFSDPPEVLPGWTLRLNAHIDGQGYDVLLQDITDKEHGYAALSDERGIIRESNPLGSMDRRAVATPTCK